MTLIGEGDILLPPRKSQGGGDDHPLLIQETDIILKEVVDMKTGIIIEVGGPAAKR